MKIKIYFQIWKKLSIGTRFRRFEPGIQQWRLLCNKPPKGFEKYFPGQKGKDSTKQSQSQPPKQNDKQGGFQNSNKKSPFNKDFTGLGGGGSGGNGPSFGGDRLLSTLGAVGAIGFIGAFLFMEEGKEITWREFVYR